PVTATGGFSPELEEAIKATTPEHIIASILAVTRNIAADDASVKSGGWQTQLVTGVAGKTLGLVGLGRLGTAVGKIMNTAFGMKVIAWSSNLTQERADEQAKAAGLEVEDSQGSKIFRVVSKEELFKSADVISVHLVLSDRTRDLITATDLQRMKSSSFFVNTSRGPIVSEKDLLDTLKQGRIRGAALDVYNIEPLPANSEWRNPRWGKDGSSNVLLTPHSAYVEEASINGFYKQQVENVSKWSKGQEMSWRLV
ncbi:hypothetical protein Golomagni_07863, partial [Golovinomyces magnicellulatus]